MQNRENREKGSILNCRRFHIKTTSNFTKITLFNLVFFLKLLFSFVSIFVSKKKKKKKKKKKHEQEIDLSSIKKLKLGK